MPAGGRQPGAGAHRSGHAVATTALSRRCSRAAGGVQAAAASGAGTGGHRRQPASPARQACSQRWRHRSVGHHRSCTSKVRRQPLFWPHRPGWHTAAGPCAAWAAQPGQQPVRRMQRGCGRRASAAAGGAESAARGAATERCRAHTGCAARDDRWATWGNAAAAARAAVWALLFKPSCKKCLQPRGTHQVAHKPANHGLPASTLAVAAVIHSPRASGPGPLATPGTHGGSSGQRRSSAPGTPLGEAGAHALEPQGSLVRERFEPYWQRVEELTCSLVAISSTGSDSSSNGSGTTLRPITGEVSLPPGTSLLTFLAAPVQRGLYTALHLRAMLQQLPLYVEVEAPEPLWQQQEAAAAVAAAAAHSRGAMSPQALRRSSRAGVPRGGPLAPVAGGAPLTPRLPRPPGDAPAGIRDAEFVVLDVEQAQPRVQLSLVAAGGSLIAGQEQWLGLALAPERDALQHARLELTWPLANTAGGPLAGLHRHCKRACCPRWAYITKKDHTANSQRCLHKSLHSAVLAYMTSIPNPSPA